MTIGSATGIIISTLDELISVETTGSTGISSIIGGNVSSAPAFVVRSTQS